MINEQKQRTRQKCKERNRKKEKRIRETNLWKKIDKHMKKEKRSKNNVQMHFEASEIIQTKQIRNNKNSVHLTIQWIYLHLMSACMSKIVKHTIEKKTKKRWPDHLLLHQVAGESTKHVALFTACALCINYHIPRRLN